MVFYPDNPSRISRVQGLANNITEMQTAMIQRNDAEKTADQRTHETLKKIAAAKGHPSVDDYVNEVIKLLPKDVAESYKKMRDAAAEKSADVKLSLDILGIVMGLAAVPDAAKLIGPPVVRLVNYMSTWVSTMRAGSQATTTALEGAAAGAGAGAEAAAAGAAEVAEIAGAAAQDVAAGAAAAGDGAGAAAGAVTALSTGAKVAKFATWASRVVAIVAILATIGTLIYDGVEGKKQMDECKKYTLDLCSKRYSCMQTKLKFEEAFTFLSKARSVIESEQTLRDLVADGTISLTEEQIQAATAKNIKKIGDEYDADMKVFDPVTRAQKDLADMDARGSAWTNEDPNVDQMNEYLKTLEAAEHAANPTPPTLRVAMSATPDAKGNTQANSLQAGAFSEKQALKSGLILLNNHIYATGQMTPGLMQAVTVMKSGLYNATPA